MSHPQKKGEGLKSQQGRAESSDVVPLNLDLPALTQNRKERCLVSMLSVGITVMQKHLASSWDVRQTHYRPQ